MWADAAADEPRCPGSGEHGEPAAALADGWPHGRALCDVCHRFVVLDADGALREHDTSDPDEPAHEAASRREWLNTYGW
ncbi:hypothetical protein GCM10017607_07670 [Microbacterium thalassium]|nr:hypothetical protein GCM10017607_07670 [Microbacterium thalassium]